MGTLPQVLKIIFKMQRKKNNEKITRKIKSFHLIKHVFFFSPWTPPTLKPHNFLIFYSF